MTRTKLIVAGWAVAAALAAGGCRKDSNGGGTVAGPRQDRRAQAEGRLEVDQSAVLPVDVKAGVQRAFPGSTVQNVQKKTYNDRMVRYEVQLTTKDGKQVTREFDAQGKPVGGQ